MREKTFKTLDQQINILKEKGNLLREPYTKALSDGIFEIRGRVGNDISRVLYFFLL